MVFPLLVTVTGRMIVLTPALADRRHPRPPLSALRLAQPNEAIVLPLHQPSVRVLDPRAGPELERTPVPVELVSRREVAPPLPQAVDLHHGADILAGRRRPLLARDAPRLLDDQLEVGGPATTVGIQRIHKMTSRCPA